MDNLELSDHFVMVESNKGDTYGYNSILGGLRKLSKTDLIVIDKIKKQEKLTKKEKENVERLATYNFIKTIDDEYKLIEPILKQYKENVENGKSITKLLLYVTGNCMLRCSYCYINDASEMSVNETGLNCSKALMTWDVAKKAIDTFFEIAKTNNQKKLHIRFFGGEPLMNFPVIKKSTFYRH